MPTIDIPDKICSHCGGTRWYYDPKKNKHICNKKREDQYNSWKSRNIEKFREKRRIYYHTKIDKVAYYERTRKIALANPKKQHEYKLKYSRSKKGKLKRKEYILLHREQIILGKYKAKEKAKLTLSDSYIKELIIQNTNLLVRDVSQELIELKRKQLLLTRQIKNNGKDN